MAVGPDIDVDLLEAETRRTYAAVSREPDTRFLVATYVRSTFEDTRRKAIKYGANGTTVRAHKPRR
jgi:hypothetical protein